MMGDMGAFDPYAARENRYDDGVPYRRVGESGLKLPALSLGLWHNFGDDKPLQTQRDILRRAFDLGVTHFDLANNYGPPPGSAERNFGTIFAEDFRPYREQLVISSKAGWVMQPGPYGFGGSRKYLLSSLDRSLERMGLDHVDIFYSHRPDPETPLEETMGALHSAVTSGKALYVGISSYSADLTARAQEIMRELGTPLLIHQPSYSMLNRWVERGEETTTGTSGPSLLETTAAEGMGVIAFSPLAQGLLTGRYLDGVPEDSRAAAGKSLSGRMLSEENLARVRGLAGIAADRGQSLAQMAIAWVLRSPAVTSALIGASSVAQLEDSVGAAANLEFTADELAAIDEFAVDGDVNIWWGATASTS
ncbi:maltooligosyl trehalose hydrolase [Tsukamurella pulmonis]|uniref:Maltooligosyl trehalose hydrolase n=2 Tax=Tsukamurella pulmonis TaxID=47312 RepID=A0A1H1CXU0_9ACTN|nr:maltooligosyl trehalose hydrolase [Tsukamurella pulmonis]SUP22836.1 L-glyceraldehyde 3-phosphate reductase [Tsukamurella pulmonis]